VAKPELGTKRVCPSCGTKYYDLNRSPIVCPNCGTVFVVAAAASPRAAERKPEPVAKAPVEPAPALEQDVELVSLEEAEEGAEKDTGPDVDAEDEEAVVPDVEVEAEADDDAVPDPFLEEEEEEGDDVAGLLDVDAEPEEER
jgi:uncharacterized protein (TIGR02300 family)